MLYVYKAGVKMARHSVSRGLGFEDSDDKQPMYRVRGGWGGDDEGDDCDDSGSGCDIVMG